MPTVALIDFRAELPADPFAVHTADITLTQQVIEPLRRYRVVANAGGGPIQADVTVVAGKASGVELRRKVSP